MKTSLLSILVPVYNESECLPLLYERLCAVTATLPCEVEIFFVNDGSTDYTLDQVKALQKKDRRISCLDLSRNYGKEIAVSAGIDYIQGDALVIMDADLQDPPELIQELLAGIEEGFDDVYACRKTRKGESWFKKWTSRRY